MKNGTRVRGHVPDPFTVYPSVRYPLTAKRTENFKQLTEKSQILVTAVMEMERQWHRKISTKCFHSNTLR